MSLKVPQKSKNRTQGGVTNHFQTLIVQVQHGQFFLVLLSLNFLQNGLKLLLKLEVCLPQTAAGCIFTRVAGFLLTKCTCSNRLGISVCFSSAGRPSKAENLATEKPCSPGCIVPMHGLGICDAKLA